MNIFYLHDTPHTCARFHCDKHVVKMILEYAQLLCGAHRILDDNADVRLYKLTHANHPCAKWVRESDKNYRWLFNLFQCLCAEYTWRYGKTHSTQRLLALLGCLPARIPHTDNITERPVCVDVESLVQNHPIESYREYYRTKKNHIASWKNREVPRWFYGDQLKYEFLSIV